MVHSALRKHSVVLNLRLPQGRTVVGDQHHLRAGTAHRLDGGLVAEGCLTRLHHQLKPGVHGLNGLLLLVTRKRKVSQYAR